MREPDAYWRKTRRLTIGLFIFWLVITFVMNWFSGELNDFVLFGFPLGFYMAAQGLLYVYLAIIWFYNRQMRALDEAHGINDE